MKRNTENIHREPQVIICRGFASGQIWAGTHRQETSERAMSRADVIRTVRAALENGVAVEIRDAHHIERPFLRQLTSMVREHGAEILSDIAAKPESAPGRFCPAV